MAGRASVEAALSALVSKAVREVMASQIVPLKKEVRELARRVERSNWAGPWRERKKPGPKLTYTECQIVGCKSKHAGRGFCLSHYNRFYHNRTLDQLARLVEAGKQVREETAVPRRKKKRKGK